jgi:hypothetical protein
VTVEITLELLRIRPIRIAFGGGRLPAAITLSRGQRGKRADLSEGLRRIIIKKEAEHDKR